MHKLINDTLAGIKSAFMNVRNLPALALSTGVSGSIEAFAWGGIWEINKATIHIAGHELRLAWAESISSLCFTLASIVLASAAAAQRSDPRPDEQARAKGTQTLAFVLLAIPGFYAAQCLALNDERVAREAYVASDEYRADLRQANDDTLDSMMQREAARAVRRATPVVKPSLDHLLPSMLWVGFLLVGSILITRCGYLPKPETDAEAQTRVALAQALARSASAMAAIQTRKRREREEAKAAARSEGWTFLGLRLARA